MNGLMKLRWKKSRALRRLLGISRYLRRSNNFTIIESDSGASVVEFALSASILMMLLIGITQITLALYTFTFVSEAARETSRYAIVRGSACTGFPDCNATASQIQNYARRLVYPGISPSSITVTTTWLTATSTGTPATTTWSTCSSGVCNAPGNQVKVLVKYAYVLSIPFWRSTPLDIKSTSSMVISQ